MTESSLQTLLARLQAGDAQAARELVARYEQPLRRAIRNRMDTRLDRHFDSFDVCQSVLGSFFVRAALGDYESKSHEDLLRLLFAIARNKLNDGIRRVRTAQRDARREEAGAAHELEHAGRGETPSHILIFQELLERYRSRLPADVLEIARLREQDLSWDEIAARLGGSPDALRKRLSRAMDDVERDLERGAV